MGIEGGNDRPGILHSVNKVETIDGYLSSAISADFTIGAKSKIKTYFVTTSSSNITVTLSAVASSLDKVIEVIKADSGSGYVVVDGSGAETINGNATIRLVSQYNRIRIKCDGSAWYVEESHITYDTGWVSLADWTAVDITITHNINAHIRDLSWKMLWSATGADGTDNYQIDTMNLWNSTGGAWYGFQMLNSTVSSFVLRCANNGGIYLNGSFSLTGITSGYYRINVKRIL